MKLSQMPTKSAENVEDNNSDRIVKKPKIQVSKLKLEQYENELKFSLHKTLQEYNRKIGKDEFVFSFEFNKSLMFYEPFIVHCLIAPDKIEVVD